jgi:hypothetical protein
MDKLQEDNSKQTSLVDKSSEPAEISSGHNINDSVDQSVDISDDSSQQVSAS